MTTELVSAPSNSDADGVLLSSEELSNFTWNYNILTERLAQLELQLEDQGWSSLTSGSDNEFSREGLRRINALARMMWLKNPLIQRGVNVQGYYVFGQGIEVSAEDEEIDAVVQKFWKDAKNETELTSQQALVSKEHELTLFGNVYFALFVKSDTGRVRVRTIPASEIEEIVTNPEDAKEPWWYERRYLVKGVNSEAKQKTTYYKDWRYLGTEKPNDADISDAVVFQVKVGGLSDMKFGVSEVYAQMDWAKAYTKFLEDWATIVRSYARFAWNLKLPHKKGLVPAKAKLNTTLSSTSGETNPAPIPGSTFMGSPGVDMQPIRTSGATTSAEDGRRLLLMVAAGAGLPESFYGDVSVGTLATAKSLDRPTELKMVNRQSLWRSTLQALLRYVVAQAVRAGEIPGTLTIEDDGTPAIELPDMPDPETGEMTERDTTINVDFPPVLEHDVKNAVDAIVRAGTLGGNSLAGVIDDETMTRLLLQALGEQDIQAIMDVIYPPEEEGAEEELDSEPEPIVAPPVVDELPEVDEEPMEARRAEFMMVEAVTEVRQVLAKILEEG